MHLLTPFLSAFAFAFAFASSSSIPIQPPPTQWARGYAFSSAEAHPHAGVQTRDGGFFVVGDGIEADPGGSTPLRSVMLLRTDKTGNPLWQKKIGTTGYNYGKFGIQLRSGHLVVAGALELMDDALGYPVLHRVLFLLDDATGTELSRAVLDNEGAELQLRDGFMCVVEGRKDGELVATGFVGGENSTTGYADEPMFLIGGGRAELSAFQVEPNKTLTPKGSMTIDTGGGGASPAFDARQGMRVLFDAPSDAYLVSFTTTLRDDPGNFQFGMALFKKDAASGGAKQLWARTFPASASGADGHASHPYALAVQRLPGEATAGGGGGNATFAHATFALGGLAVIFDAQQIEQCEGRLLGVDAATGSVKWDRRFKSTSKDTNIECYGLQATHDGGYVLACGTGVEPELHPGDSARSKTWRVLVHRTGASGEQVWQTNYTTNDQLQNNAGEYIIATKDGGYAVYVDSQTYGPQGNGGNFAVMKLAPDEVERSNHAHAP
jgi:hypothetical protein